MSTNALSAEVGLSQTTLSRWLRDARTVPFMAKKVSAESKRIRELERELRRKEKALAETAALLILKKKHNRSGGTRTTTRNRGGASRPGFSYSPSPHSLGPTWLRDPECAEASAGARAALGVAIVLGAASRQSSS